MTQDRQLELPQHLTAKIQKVLGSAPSVLGEQGLLSLIEELCDTALMFDREERDGEEAVVPAPATEVPGAAP